MLYFLNKFPHFLHTTFNILLLNICDVPGSLTGTEDAKINKAITLPSRTSGTGREDRPINKLLQYIVISGEIKKKGVINSAFKVREVRGV